MKGFVVDNSVVVSWFFKDELNPYTEEVRQRLLETQALVPAIWPLEFANVLVMAERRKRLTSADVSHILSIAQNLPVSIEHEPPDRVWSEILQLARSQSLTAYDASYLDLAMRSGLPIASQDKALIRAARKCGVAIFAERRPRKKS